MTYQHVLAAVDLEEDSQFVLEQAKKTADAHGAELSVVTVLRPIVASYSGLGLTSIDGPMTFQADVERGAHAKLAESAAAVGVEPGNVHVLFGSPAVKIRDTAEASGADLIVMGTHGRQGLGLLLGSTASGVLHGVKCDVLALRIREAA